MADLTNKQPREVYEINIQSTAERDIKDIIKEILIEKSVGQEGR